MANSIEVFIKNLETVLSDNEWSNRALAKKSGVSDRLIGMYRNRETAPSIEKAEMIAKALGFELWQMQMPDFRPDVLADGGFDRLFHSYINSDQEGRNVMESTADYISHSHQEPSNAPDGQEKKSAG